MNIPKALPASLARLLLLLCIFFSVPSNAANPLAPFYVSTANPYGTLFLFQKCTNPGNVCPTDPGPWPVLPGSNRIGTLIFNLSSNRFNYILQAENLTTGNSYTLVYYPDPWPGNGLICLSNQLVAATYTDSNGIVHLGFVTYTTDTGLELATSLPIATDDNFSLTSPGAKIWLVPSSDADCFGEKMTGWNPGDILFEYNTIVYTDTDAP